MNVSLLKALLKIPNYNSPQPYQIGLYKSQKKKVSFGPATKYLPEGNEFYAWWF
jgi:hypothetical protein